MGDNKDGNRVRENAVAAILSGSVAALVTNPLDVVKTRMQVEAASAAAQKLAGNWTHTCNFYARLPVRAPHPAPINASPNSSLDLEAVTKSLGARLRSLRSGSPAVATAEASSQVPATWWEPRLAGAGVSGCVCLEELLQGEAATGEGVTGANGGSRRLWPPHSCSARAPTFQQQGMMATFKQMVQQEGVSSLWRGLDSALMLTVPQVLLYYPLYDALMAEAHKVQQKPADASSEGNRMGSPDGSSASDRSSGSSVATSSNALGYATPMLCGAVARTVAVFAVAPLELARTRQQALHRPSTARTGAGTPSNPIVLTPPNPTHPHQPLSTAQSSHHSSLGSAQEAHTPAHTLTSNSKALRGHEGSGAGGSQGHTVGIPSSHQTHPQTGAHAPHAPMNTWGALQSGLGIDVTSPTPTRGEGGSQAAGQQGAGARVPASTVVRSLPRLWTGFGATIARDVPFSALYWGLLEPIRATLLSYSSAASNSSTTTSSPVQWAGGVDHTSVSAHSLDGTSTSPHRRGEVKVWSNSDAQEWLMTDAAAGSMAPLAPCTLESGSANRGEIKHHRSRGDGNVCEAQLSSSGVGGGRQQSHLEGGYPGNGRDASADSSSMLASQAREGQPGASSSTQLVWVNLTAGSAAGAAAAAATTPFDVVKTRIQTATRSAGGDAKVVVSPLSVMRQVYGEGGVGGLFVGLGPRAVRCAPACAIVVACYELFKSWL